jgi:hypothetical protein
MSPPHAAIFSIVRFRACFRASPPSLFGTSVAPWPRVSAQAECVEIYSLVIARRTLVVGTLAALCFLAGRPASAWVPTPNRPRLAAAARPVTRCVPVHEHADPSSGQQAPAALLQWGTSDRRPVSTSARGRRGAGADDWSIDDDRRWPDGHETRSVSLVPSHWGATHLQI